MGLEINNHPRTSILRSPKFNPNKIAKSAPQPHSKWKLGMVRAFFAGVGRMFPKQVGKAAFRLFSTPLMRSKGKRISELEQQATAFTFTAANEQIQAYRWGKSDKKILLLHGWESRGLALRAFVRPLLDAGFEVLTFDAPAHGKSTGKQTNYYNYGDVIESMIQREGEFYGFIAHSMGTSTLVSRLSELGNKIETSKLVLISMPFALAGVIERFRNLVKLAPSAEKEMIQALEKSANRGLDTLTVAHFCPQVRAKEVLLLHDRYDLIVPFSDAEQNLAVWKNAHLLITEGYGHNRIIRDSSVIQKVAEFFANSN